MRNPQDNLYACLFKWAHRQDENFTTEAFAHLLRFLLGKEAELGVSLLKFLTGDRLALPAADANAVEVTTQVTTESGRPDVEIRAGDHLVYVEAKDRSGLGRDQVQRYLDVLAGSGAPHTTLVLLTRYPLEKSGGLKANVERRWYEVAAVLEHELAQHAWQHAEAKFLTEQFVAYLQMRGMAMDHVGCELKDGVRAWVSLVTMVYEGLKNLVPRRKYSIGQEWAGCYTDDTSKAKAWVGITWADPTVLLFHSRKICVTQETVAAVGVGEFNKEKRRWELQLDLASDREGFFAKTKADQQGRVGEFIREAVAALEKLETMSA